MARQGYDLQLTRYDDRGWRATFYMSGIAHSVVKGSAWERDAVASGAGGGMGHVEQGRGEQPIVQRDGPHEASAFGFAESTGHTGRKHSTVSRSGAELASSPSDRCRTVPAGLLGQISDSQVA